MVITVSICLASRSLYRSNMLTSSVFQLRAKFDFCTDVAHLHRSGEARNHRLETTKHIGGKLSTGRPSIDILAAPNLVPTFPPISSRLVPQGVSPTDLVHVVGFVHGSLSCRHLPPFSVSPSFPSNLAHTNTSKNNKRQLVQVRQLVLVRRLGEIADLGDVDGGVAEVVLCSEKEV